MHVVLQCESGDIGELQECQAVYCQKHTRISPHGVHGQCGLESACYCLECFNRQPPEIQVVQSWVMIVHALLYHPTYVALRRSLLAVAAMLLAL